MPFAARNLGRPVKFTEDRREHFISSAHERGQLQQVEVGFDDDGRLLGMSVRFWHDNGAYLPYGLIVPIITSTQLLGPYKLPAYRVEFDSLYTNTVIVTPYRGAGRPQGVFVMERTLDAIARRARPGPGRGARGELHPAGRDALRPGADLPGRPAAGLRLGRLPGVAGEAEEAGRLGLLDRIPGRGPGRGPPGRARTRLLRRGNRGRPVRGRARPGGDVRQGEGGHRAHLAGPGAPDRVRPDRRRRARRAAVRHRGGHRRHPAVPLRGRHVRLPGGGDERLGDRAGRAGRQGQDPQGGRRRAGGRRRPTWRSWTAGSGWPACPAPRSRSAPSRCCPTRCATPSTRRPRRPPSSRWAIRTPRRCPRTTSRASRAGTTTRRCARRSPTGCTRWWWRPIRRPPRSGCCATAWCTTAAP